MPVDEKLSGFIRKPFSIQIFATRSSYSGYNKRSQPHQNVLGVFIFHAFLFSKNVSLYEPTTYSHEPCFSFNHGKNEIVARDYKFLSSIQETVSTRRVDGKGWTICSHRPVFQTSFLRVNQRLFLTRRISFSVQFSRGKNEISPRDYNGSSKCLDWTRRRWKFLDHSRNSKPND